MKDWRKIVLTCNCKFCNKFWLVNGGMAEWLKAAVLKTVERKLRGFESYSLRHFSGEMAELAEGARLLSE